MGKDPKRDPPGRFEIMNAVELESRNLLREVVCKEIFSGADLDGFILICTLLRN
jgi:hypothetical protein